MKILALDLGATTGWAVVEYGKATEWGEDTFEGNRPRRFRNFRNWLIYRIKYHEPDTVIYERPFCRGLHATRSLWGMAGVVEEVVVDCAACLDIVPTTLKKWATGSGRASKQDMIAAAYALAPCLLYHVKLGEHEADAIILGLYAAENIEPGE